MTDNAKTNNNQIMALLWGNYSASSHIHKQNNLRIKKKKRIPMFIYFLVCVRRSIVIVVIIIF